MKISDKRLTRQLLASNIDLQMWRICDFKGPISEADFKATEPSYLQAWNLSM